MSGPDFSLTVFRRDTGLIVYNTKHTVDPDFKSVVIGNIIKHFGEDTHGYVEQASDRDKHYVATVRGAPAVLDRPPIPYQVDKTTIRGDGEDYLTLTELHDPCTLVIDDPDPTVETSTHTVTGGGFEFSADTPGVYTIEISHFPFLPMRLEITAT